MISQTSIINIRQSNIVEDMLTSRKFQVSFTEETIENKFMVDLVCNDGNYCEFCPYSIQTHNVFVTECYYTSVEQERINDYIIRYKPHLVFKAFKETKLSEKVFNYWLGFLKKEFPIQKYPELWV